jgi:hypothetical protein
MLITESDGAKCVCLLTGSTNLVTSTGLFSICLCGTVIYFPLLVLLLSRISFNKGFVNLGPTMFLSMDFSDKYIVINYNRVQHVALHEGFISGILDWQNRSFNCRRPP